MTERELRRRLASVGPPDEAGAERRAWTVVRGAFAEREPVRWPRRHWRPALVLAVAVAVVAAAASPAGRAVLDAVRDAVGRDRVEPSSASLRGLPGPGRLLVNSSSGPWVVAADGHKRRLGPYRDAAWSPHGLFVVAVGRHELVALDPDLGPGDNLRWTLTRPGRITEPRWAPGDGYRIAYLEERTLRVVGGDGRGDRAVARRVVPGSLAWRPGDRRHVLAYLTAGGRLVVRNVDSGRVAWEMNVEPPARLAWSTDGRRLVVVSPKTITVFAGDGRRAGGRVLPAVTAFAVAPDGRVALIRRLAPNQTELLLLTRSLRRQRLFSAYGQLTDVAWSPNARRLLVGWRSADQWLLLRPGSTNVPAYSDIARQFGSAPGSFPSIDPQGWCCPG